jgi:hypothetical protein
MAAEDAPLSRRTLERWANLGAGHVGRLTTPRGRTIALILFSFLLTLLVYRLTSQGPPTANMPIRLADAFLHGRLDIWNGEQLPWLDWAFYEGKYYMLEPPITALVVLPGVLLFGLDLNQTLVSVVIGSLTAAVVFRLMRGLTEELSVQVWLTLLIAFGTIYWWNAVNGGTWYFAHAVSVLFLFLAVHETLVGKRPFAAGLFLGAAYLARLPTILSFPFFFIMFSDRWWRPKPDFGEKPLRERIDIKPLLQLGSGVGIFVLLSFVYNYLRFEDPLQTGYSVWANYTMERDEGLRNMLNEGLFDISYVSRNIPLVFQAVPVFPSEGPYVYSSMSGMAIWATTPAFLYALFAGVRNRAVLVAGAAALIVAIVVLIFSARGLSWLDLSYAADFDFQLRLSSLDLLYDLSVLPFLFLIAYGVFVGLRGNKLVLACWSAILPIAAVHFVYPITGWPQFGYRYALDYYPFLFLLAWVGIGNRIRWHHMILIAASIAINVVGILWWYEFQPRGLGGIEWVRW